jgi:hypothetical protein
MAHRTGILETRQETIARPGPKGRGRLEAQRLSPIFWFLPHGRYQNVYQVAEEMGNPGHGEEALFSSGHKRDGSFALKFSF